MNYKISNIKGLLIFLVIFGHIIEFDRYKFKLIYEIIYSFHMPLFIFITGYLSKNVKFSKIFYLLKIFIPLQIIYIVLVYLFNPEYNSLSIQFTRPIYHLWYIFSIVWYYLIVIFFRKIQNRNIILIIIIFLAVAAMLSRYLVFPFHTYFLSFQRTLSFLPFFLLGYLITPQLFDQITTDNYKSKNLFLILISLISFYVLLKLSLSNSLGFDLSFRGSNTISGSTLQKKYGYIITMLITYSIPILISYVILVATKNKKGILSIVGNESLLLFLLHPLLTIPISKYISTNLNINNFLLIIVYFMLSIVITSILTFLSLEIKKCNISNPFK